MSEHRGGRREGEGGRRKTVQGSGFGVQGSGLDQSTSSGYGPPPTAYRPPPSTFRLPPFSENPFCSRRVRPGALPFLFAPDQNAAELVDRLCKNAWWGQVVGPHGSGKSALLVTLIPAIEAAGKRTLLVGLHDGQRRLPLDLRRTPGLNASAVLIVDGYEQLGGFARFRLKRFCRRGGPGLLVAAHVPVGLPDLFRTTVDLKLARQVVEQLQREYPSHVSSEDVAERFSRHGGDLREMLFDLYDLYEQRRRGKY